MANDPDIVQKISVDTDIHNALPVDVNTTQTINADTDVIQKLSADFNVVNDISIDFNSSVQPLEAQLGSIYIVGGDNRVLYASTNTWNSQPFLIAERGFVYIYSDYRKTTEGQNIASMKIGDGNAYLIDLPFMDVLLYDHLADNVRHITQEEREKWNNKVRCYISEVKDDILIFTTN